MNHTSLVGVYAVILNTQGDQILLIRKARGPYTGLLDLPGGSIEAGETVEVALEREVDEETSCRVFDKRLLGAYQIDYPYVHPYAEQKCLLHHTGILYAAMVSGTPSAAGDGLDSRGAVWTDIDDIGAHKTTPFVLIGLRAARVGNLNLAMTG